MEFKDNCPICLVVMNRGAVVQLGPCGHILHQKCYDNMPAGSSCPICRTLIESTSSKARKKYKRIPTRDRELVTQAANRGSDWVELAASMGINYKTAHNWVTAGRSGVKK